MKIASRVAATLAFLLLGAHFLREGSWALLVLCLGMIAASAWRNRWAQATAQLALALGTLEWVRTALLLVQERTAEGRPWLRLAVILAAVAAFTAASAWMLRRAKPASLPAR